MYVDGEKFISLVAVYGKDKGYPEKSYLPMFCKDFDLAYNQWYAYTKGKQVVGIKIIHRIIEIFPNINLNWFLKDDPNMFTHESDVLILEEPKAIYNKKVTNEDLMTKLEEIQNDLKKQLKN